MSQSPEVPDYLQSTYQLLKCAFPNDITEEQYAAILHFLHPHMSFRTLATVLASVTNKTYIHILNDTMGYEGKPLVDSTIMDSVRKKLDDCGYDEWINSE